MILQILSEVEFDGEKRTIETVRDNVTSVTDFGHKLDVSFSRPNGEIDLIAYNKPHHQIFNMWLLNDNFKTLKRLI